MSNDTPKPPAIAGLLAVAFAATDLTTTIAAEVLARMGRRYEKLALSFSWLVFDYGFLLCLLAVVLAILAFTRGGHNRRLALVSVLLIGLTFFAMFLD